MNNVQRQHHTLRQGISDTLIKFLSRAKGLDLLRYSEQSETRITKVPMNAINTSTVPEGDLVGIETAEDGSAVGVLEKFERIWYPVPGYPEAYHA